jgi:hypothetical protein
MGVGRNQRHAMLGMMPIALGIPCCLHLPRRPGIGAVTTLPIGQILWADRLSAARVQQSQHL